MKIVVAPDSFKECLSSLKVSNYISKGILKVFPRSTIKIVPMADGGEGTLQSLHDALHGQMNLWRSLRPTHLYIFLFHL